MNLHRPSLKSEETVSGTATNTAVYGSVASVPASVDQAGGLSPYGTMGQGGNVWQWLESAHSGSNTNVNDLRTTRGGSWNTLYDYNLQSTTSYGTQPGGSDGNMGFRVAAVTAVPEPSTYALFGIGTLGLVIAVRRKVFLN